MQMGLAGWLDVSVWFIRAVNYVLDGSDVKKNTEKREHFQAQMRPAI